MQEIKRKKNMTKEEYVEYRRVYGTNWDLILQLMIL